MTSLGITMTDSLKKVDLASDAEPGVISCYRREPLPVNIGPEITGLVSTTESPDVVEEPTVTASIAYNSNARSRVSTFGG